MLSKRQKEILWLLLQGHDAKSLARLLDLSVHTVNEHLRDARRVLRVTSSREAARLLAEAEKPSAKLLGDIRFGVDARQIPATNTLSTGANRSLLYGVGVVVVILIAAIAFAALSGSEPRSPNPRVVATNPRAGAKISPGAFVLSVTFDRPMLDDNWSIVQVSPETFPQCSGKPKRALDARTFTWKCVAAPRRQYEVWLNRQPYMNFKSTDGVRAEPYRLVFTAR